MMPRWSLLLMCLALPLADVRAEADHGIELSWRSDTFMIWPLEENTVQHTAVVSWSDWLVKDEATFGTPGVRYILNEMALSGVRRVWWRTFGGGWALYPSQAPGVTTGDYPGQGADYSQYDSLTEAVNFGHRLGLEVYAWFTPLEEAHGWADNVRSHYVDAHPEFWDRNAEGQPVATPSFYHAAYRDYKLALAQEVVTRYDTDGLVIDFERIGVPNRTNELGYLPEIVAAFHRETGLDARRLPSNDARWMRFRARYVGLFMRDVRRMLDELDRDVELVVMAPADEPVSAHWDIPHWVEQGWVDRLVLVDHGTSGWGYPTQRATEVMERYRGFGVPLSLVIYAHMGDDRGVERAVERALTAGFEEIVWFETTYLHFKDRYDMPRELACPAEATLASPPVELTGGGEVTVLAAGAWTLGIDGVDQPLARGEAGRASIVALPRLRGEHRLVVRCELPAESGRAGVAVQGWARDGAGREVAIRTDRTWRVIGGGSPITVGQPGVPPFIGDFAVRRASTTEATR